MTTQIDLDAMGIEDLVDLSERAQKKLNEKIAAEKADLEKRQAAFAKLTDRVAGKKPAKTPSRPKAEGAGKTAGAGGGAGAKPPKEEGEAATAGADGGTPEAIG
jgi:hypothetical protein